MDQNVIDRNKFVVRLVTEKGFNEGDLSGISDYFSADYKVNAPGIPPLPPGPQAFHQAVLLFRNAFPDIRVNIEDVIGEADRVYTRFITRGTHTGSLMGIPPTGLPVTIYETTCHRLENGKVVESWIGDNVPNILHQVGALVDRRELARQEKAAH
jgi:predicted ester cyclase